MQLIATQLFALSLACAIVKGTRCAQGLDARRDIWSPIKNNQPLELVR